jgi:tetratricopeptide (TPR) repeat protein
MSDPQPTVTHPEPPTPARPRSRARRRWVLGLLALLVVIAAATFLWWRSRPPADPTAERLQAARAALVAHRPDEAQNHLHAVLAQWPLDAEAHFLLARACRRADDLAGWQEHLRTAELLHWPATELERERLCGRAQTGDVWAAEAELLPLLAAGDDESAVVAEALIKGYLVTFRLDDVLSYCQGWIDRRPDDWPPYYLRGRAYLYARLLARAIDDFRRVLALWPDHAPARLRLASAHMVEGQYESARAEYEAYLAAHPPAAEALFGLANCQFNLAQSDAARATLDRLFALQPDHPAGCFVRAKLEMQTNPAEALAWLRKAERQAPHETDVTSALVQALTQTGQADEAACYQLKLDELRADLFRLDELRKEVRTDPDRPAPRLEAGELCAWLGREAEAVHWFQSVLRLDPNHAAAHRALAELYERQGDPRAAYHRARAANRN